MLKVNVLLFGILNLCYIPQKLIIMTKKLLFTFLFFFGYFPLISQTITGKVVDKVSLEPIQNVAIITNLNRGSTSNTDGEFTVQSKNLESITFSSLGYVTLTLSFDQIKKLNYRILLVEKVNTLDEIKLNLSKISLDSLLIKTARTMKNKFISGATKNHFYAREYSAIDFKKLELDLEKSSLLTRKNKRLAEKELADYAFKLKNSNPEFSSEFVGILRSKEVKSEKTKRNLNLNNLDSVQGITFMNNENDVTLEKTQNKLQNIVLKHLDTTKTYKISSGLFKLEDSLSINEIIKETDSLGSEITFYPNKPAGFYNSAIQKSKFFNKKNQTNFFDTKYYNHQLEKPTLLGSKLLYVVNFEPRKSKSKFSGKIFIDPADYTISKIEYQFANKNKGKSINLKWLLGLKVSEDVRTVCMYYEKNKDSKVFLSYYNETFGIYAYLHRPIKFKENSVKKDKVKFDIKIEVNTKLTLEFLISEAYNINEAAISPLKKEDLKKRKPYLLKEEYDVLPWRNRQLIHTYLKKWD